MISKLKIHTPIYLNLLKGFDAMIVAQGYRQTGKTYQNNVKEFLSYLESQGILSVKKIQAVNMVGFYEHISNRSSYRGYGVLKSSTISGKMFAVELFFDYLIETKHLTSKIVLPRHRRTDYSERNVVTVNEIKLIYDACECKRDRAIVSLAYGCGLRRTEMVELDIKDILLGQHTLIVRQGKNSKRREIPLAGSVLNELKTYLNDERHVYLNDEIEFNDAFLINNQGKRMRGAHINKKLKAIIDRVSDPSLTAKGITLHCLRHSIATHLLEAGASFEFVRDYLGHAEIDTVHIYARRRRIKEKQQKTMNR